MSTWVRNISRQHMDGKNRAITTCTCFRPQALSFIRIGQARGTDARACAPPPHHARTPLAVDVNEGPSCASLSPAASQSQSSSSS